MNLRLYCHYCGSKWEEQIFYSRNRDIKCPNCGESKLLKQIKPEEEKKDVFGYGDAIAEKPKAQLEQLPEEPDPYDYSPTD